MAQAGLQAQTAGGFLGVNLRKNRVSLADQDVARAINADLHSQVGTIVLRLGRTKQFTNALTETTIRRLAKINNIRYQVAGRSVFRNQVNILSGLLSTNLVTTLVPYRPLNDTMTYAFIADDSVMRKDDGMSVTTWGITAPSGSPTVATGAAGSLSGNYSVRYTYIRKVGSAIAGESNPSPASNTVSLSAQQLSVTGIARSGDPQVTHVRLYRTSSSNSVYLFDQDILNGTTTATSTQADTALGTAVDLTGNATPPIASWAVLFQDSVFLCRDSTNPHYLWYSKRFQPESVPATNFLEIGNPDDPLQCAVSGPGILGVFTKRTKYRVVGNIQSGFEAQQSFSTRGTLAFHAVLATEYGIVFPALDGVFLTNMISADVNLAEEILPLFLGDSMNGLDPINWDAASVMAAGTYKERYYLSYPSGSHTTPDMLAVYSTHTKKWYHYNHPIQSFFYENDVDDFTAGGLDGFVYLLERGSTDSGASIALTVDTKDFQIQSPMR